jgi:threonine aldolase
VDVVDLRSDTVTRPGPEMRKAMAEAEVGDDVYGEDPTVNALEAEVAALFGHEAALFVPSGSMGNQLAVRLLVRPGQELLCDADAHVVTFELGAAAVHGQALGVLQRLRALADAGGIALHCDGARIWNAHVATGTPLAGYGVLFETLSVCLSKGLGAPVGSLLVSSAERVAEARVLRKRLGGGMRQAGILAAAGRYALAHHLPRLAEDHAHARRLAELLGVDPAGVPSNIVAVPVPDAAAVAAAARGEGVLVGALGPRLIRCVTHLDVDVAGIEHAGQVLATLLPG